MSTRSLFGSLHPIDQSNRPYSAPLRYNSATLVLRSTTLQLRSATTTSFNYNNNYSVKLHDTPGIRRIADALSAPHARRADAFQSCCPNVRPSFEPTANIAMPLPSLKQSASASHDLHAAHALRFGYPTDRKSIHTFTDPIISESVPSDSAACSIEQMNSAVIDAMLDGSDQFSDRTSVYDTLIPSAPAPHQITVSGNTTPQVAESFTRRPTIKFPDTPEARRAADMLSAMEQRRSFVDRNILQTQIADIAGSQNV